MSKCINTTNKMYIYECAFYSYSKKKAKYFQVTNSWYKKKIVYFNLISKQAVDLYEKNYTLVCCRFEQL